MAVRPDKELTLGILFTARPHKSLAQMDKKIEASLKKAQASLNRYAKGLRKVDQASAQLSKTKANLNKQIGKAAGAWNRLKAAAKVTASYGLAATAIYSVTNALRAGTTELMNYDQALHNLQAITQASDAHIEGMGETMRQLARDTKFSTTEVADGMVLLGQAGLSASEVIGSIGAVTTLATGTLSSMANTTDLVTSTMRAFGLEASDSGRIVDVMASAINRSKLTIEKLRVAFNFVGAAAAQTGLSLEDTAATMMVLANNGLRASTIGTGMRQVLSRLLAPSAKLRDAFEAHGIALEKVNPRLVGYQKAIKNLAPLIWDNQKGVVNMAKAYELFGLRGAQAAAVIVKAYVSGTWDDMLEKVYDVGSATRMAAIQQEGLAVKWKNFQDRVKNIALAFGDAGLTGVLRSLFTWMQKVATMIEIFIRDWGNLTIKVMAFATAAALAARAIIALNTAMKAAMIIQGVATGFKALTVVLFGSTVAVGGLTAGFVALNAALGPIGWAVLLSAAAWTTWYTVIKARNKESKKSITQIRRENTVLEANAAKVKTAREQLAMLSEKHGEGVENQREYKATLKRLVDEYPALAVVIDQVGDSYEETEKKLEAFHRELQKDLWKGWGEDVKEQLGRFGSGVKERQLVILELARENLKFFMQLPKEAQAAATRIENITNQIAESLSEMVKNGEHTMMSARFSLMSIFGHDSAAVQITFDKILEYLNKIKKVEDKLGSTDAETEKARKVRLDSDRQYYSMISKWRSDDVLAAEAAHLQNLINIEKWASKRYEIAKGSDIQMRALRDKERALIKTEEDRFENELIKIDKNRRLEHATWKYKQKQAEIAKEYSAEALNETQRLEMEQKKTEADREFHRVKVAILDKYIAELKKHYSEESDVVKQAQMEKDNLVAESQISLLKSETKGNKERLKQYEQHLQRWLRETDKKSKEWLYVLDEARKADLISQREYEDAMLAATGSWFDNFKHGLERAGEELKSWGDVWQDVGADINDVMASGMTDAIWDFVEGTKSAKEAFQDFAQSMLKWLAEIIIKQQILNMLQAIGSGGGYAPVASAPVAGTTAPVVHAGGIVGKPAPVRVVNSNAFLNAPRLHAGGIAGNEVPAILKKGEGVFTEEQMAAMGSQNIEIVNLTDTRLMESYLASPKGQNAILNVIGKNSRTVRRIVR